jgi:hypothetical protein
MPYFGGVKVNKICYRKHWRFNFSFDYYLEVAGGQQKAK